MKESTLFQGLLCMLSATFTPVKNKQPHQTNHTKPTTPNHDAHRFFFAPLVPVFPPFLRLPARTPSSSPPPPPLRHRRPGAGGRGRPVHAHTGLLQVEGRHLRARGSGVHAQEAVQPGRRDETAGGRAGGGPGGHRGDARGRALEHALWPLGGEVDAAQQPPGIPRPHRQRGAAPARAFSQGGDGAPRAAGRRAPRAGRGGGDGRDGARAVASVVQAHAPSPRAHGKHAPSSVCSVQRQHRGSTRGVHHAQGIRFLAFRFEHGLPRGQVPHPRLPAVAREGGTARGGVQGQGHRAGRADQAAGQSVG